MHRRALLKGAAITMPMILTLQSGAALARSSNLISASPYGYEDANGRTMCLDLDSVYPAGDYGDKYDLGEPAYGRVSAINDRDYRRSRGARAERVSEKQMCTEGRTYYYKDRSWLYSDVDDNGATTNTQSNYYGIDDRENKRSKYGGKRGWKEVQVPQGILVSATALSSFAGHIVITDL